MPKIVYIAHPISGDVEANLAEIRKIVRWINLNCPDITPQVPYYCDCVSMDDNVPSERKRGIDNDTELILTGVYKELWLTGSKVSFGMSEEIKLFRLLGKLILDYTAHNAPWGTL